MIETTVTITRGPSTTIQSGVSVQIDTASPMLAAWYNNSHPYDVFDCYIKYATGYTVLRQDLLTDEVNLDPLTSAAVKYRVVSRPESFFDGHIECVVDQFAGGQS